MKIKVNEAAIIQRGTSTYTAGEVLDVPSEDAEHYIKEGSASKVK